MYWAKGGLDLKSGMMDDVDKIIASIPLLKGRTWTKTVLDGWSNRTLLLSADQTTYVLRIPLYSDKNDIDRCHEFVNLKSIIPLHITPNTLYFDSQTGVQLRDFVEGEALITLWMTDDKLQLCADILRRLHQSAVQFEPINMVAHMLEDCARLREAQVPLDPRYEPLIAYCAREVDTLDTGMRAPCHMDPNLYNFVMGDRLWLIDFEYAHQYDPAWDLAYFITSAKLNDEQVQVFCQAYGADRVLRERIDAFKPLTQFSQAIWVMQQIQLGHSRVGEEALRAWEQDALASALSAHATLIR